MTVRHAHNVLSKALSDAVRNDLLTRNVCKLKLAPKVLDAEMVIVQDVPSLIEKLRGWRLGVLATVALLTGMRLGEILALRWNRVDLDHKVAKIREALEQYSLQAAKIQSRPPRYRAARYLDRHFARSPQSCARTSNATRGRTAAR